ncbi:MAG: beta-1,3-glucanase family protein, partial [Propionibacteriaceae bacterium]
DASIPGPADGASVTVDVPRNISGRVYFSFGSTLNFGLVDAGLVQPAPWNPSDDNADILFDWSEFTFNDYGLWLNSTQVDQFAVPHTVSVTGDDGSTSTTGALVDGGRQKIIDAVEQTAGFEKTVVRGNSGEVLRVLSPGKATGVDAMSATYLDDYIDEAWSAYRTKKLTVVPFAHEPETKFFGTTTGDDLVFTNTAGEQVARFPKPTTANVWDCDGALAAPNDHVVGPISRTLCAALHRGTLGDSSQEPVTDAGRFYQRELTNHYSAIVHANMKDGKAYGFAFDDVTGQESLVHSGGPVKASITLGTLD